MYNSFFVAPDGEPGEQSSNSVCVYVCVWEGGGWGALKLSRVMNPPCQFMCFRYGCCNVLSHAKLEWKASRKHKVWTKETERVERDGWRP